MAGDGLPPRIAKGKFYHMCLHARDLFGNRITGGGETFRVHLQPRRTNRQPDPDPMPMPMPMRPSWKRPYFRRIGRSRSVWSPSSSPTTEMVRPLSCMSYAYCMP